MANRKSAKKAMPAPKSTKKKRAGEPITIVLPADISAGDRAILEGIAQMLLGADYDASTINLVRSDDLAAPTQQDLKGNGMSIMTSCP
jgi:hypothetical protein